MEQTGKYKLPEDLKVRLEIEARSEDKTRVLQAVIRAVMPEVSQAIIWHDQYEGMKRMTYESIFADAETWDRIKKSKS